MHLVLKRCFFAGVATALALTSAPLGGMATPARAPQPEPMNSHSQARPNSDAALVAELQSKVKYVFVLYQENRSFDSYFGTFPGANGLFSQSPKETPGYYQPIINTDGSAGVVTPFRIGLAQYAADTDDAQHAHELMLDKIHVKGGAPRMDGYAITEERVYSPSGDPSLQAKQFGELTMAHEDCDTIPIFWQYASQFTLFDEIFQEVTGPSTPGNIAIFTAQSGATQYLRHPGEKVAGDGDSGPGVPDLNDSNPFWGSSEDTTPASEKMPYNPGDGGTPQVNLTFASLPLTLQGQDIGYITASDRNPKRDLADTWWPHAPGRPHAAPGTGKKNACRHQRRQAVRTIRTSRTITVRSISDISRTIRSSSRTFTASQTFWRRWTRNSSVRAAACTT